MEAGAPPPLTGNGEDPRAIDTIGKPDAWTSDWRAHEDARRASSAWAADDRFFPPEHGRRIAQLARDGRFTLIEDSYTFLSEDQPDALAKEILGFLDAA